MNEISDVAITAMRGRESQAFLAVVPSWMSAVFTTAALLQAVPALSLRLCAKFR